MVGAPQPGVVSDLGYLHIGVIGFVFMLTMGIALLRRRSKSTTEASAQELS